MKSMSDQATAIPRQVEEARAAFGTGRTADIAWRKDQLRGLVRLLDENGDSIERAMTADLGKHPAESYLTEISTVKAEANKALKNIGRWTRDKRVRSLLALAPSRAVIHREPLGTVLIIGPWNYPFHLLFMPLVGALTAGNAVVLKPSELAPECSKVIAELVPKYLDDRAVQVVEGGIDETSALLQERFDHIFYTGNGTVGSIVMAAAARHLTPVTLELGGKSPVWVDDSADIAEAAKWLAWGKFANCGQTCVAPDYVLTTREVAPRLAAAVSDAIAKLYGSDPRESADYGRIISERHTQRLAGLIGSGTVVIGGTVDVDARYVAPTVLVDVELDDPVMRDEIFGPILPIVVVADLDAAIDVIRSREKPLALYGFTNDAQVRSALLERTSSGGVVFGAVMIHLGVSTLPFGGVGHSGMGAYHGERSVRTFSHERAVLRKLKGPDLAAIGRPPYTERKQGMIRRS